MLYLLMSKGIDNVIDGAPEEVVTLGENVIIPSFKMLAEGEGSKKFVGGELPGQRAWVIIADFPNHEEANKWVMSLPFWNLQHVEIMPLVSFQSQLDSINKMIQTLKSRLKNKL